MNSKGNEEELLLEEKEALCTLDTFVDYEDVLAMIDRLPEVVRNSQEEKARERYKEVLDHYQEQPHLIDQHVNVLLSCLIAYIRAPTSSEELRHEAFRYLYHITKVRSYKGLLRYFPHEIGELDGILTLLEQQDPTDNDRWETRYVLLVWMSILVLNPFHLARLDGDNVPPESRKMHKIFQICKVYTRINDPCSNIGAFLCGKFLIRADMKDIYLPEYFNWVRAEEVTEYGQLAGVAAVLKNGKRDDILPYAPELLRWILGQDFKTSNDFLKYKLFVKVIQRLGLVFLAPRLAHWRYQRGSRSLVKNLEKVNDPEAIAPTQHEEIINPDEITFSVPDELEEVVDELLQALRSSSSDVRWLAAKGIGRITNRLPKSLGDEVVSSVIEILNPLEPHEAWHGTCLALAELAKRGLLLPYRLPALVPLLLQALTYDEIKGYMSVGLNIRDAACYMCWAFARAYAPTDLQPFVNEIAAGLVVTAVFDREINCRRAAAAAFQECVGRLGNFPHGIDIITTADYFSVGLRTNAFLSVSDYVGQFEEYVRPMIDHLIQRKVNHWDIAIRELTAKALNILCKHDPVYMSDSCLETLFQKTKSIDVNSRHGAVLAIGEIVLALSQIDASLLKQTTIDQLGALVLEFHTKEMFRGMSGELMKLCSLDLIRNCSEARVPVGKDCVESWRYLIDLCVANKTSKVREGAIFAFPSLCEAYYAAEELRERRTTIVEVYLKGSRGDLEEHARMGNVSALGVLPKFMLMPQLDLIVDTLVELASIASSISNNENPITLKWSEARRDTVKALTNIVQTVGYEEGEESFVVPERLRKVFQCFLNGLDEYTLDNRGDIGAWVREASMTGLFVLLTTCPASLLPADFVHEAMQRLAQQAVEKIDRTRGLAGKLFCNLVHHSPPVAHIRRHDELREIFPEDSSTVLWLFADKTFPLFCEMLQFEVYSERLILGLTASMGQLTESLVKYSSTAFLDYLRTNRTIIGRIGTEIVQIFADHLNNDRVISPMLNFLDVVLNSDLFHPLLMDESANFADEIFRLVNLEISGHKKLYKLLSSINVFCHLIQVPRLYLRVLSKLTLFLGISFVQVRKNTAIKLYESLLLYGDQYIQQEEALSEILELLSETDWGQPVTEIRPVRNRLCELFGVKAPQSTAVAAAKS